MEYDLSETIREKLEELTYWRSETAARYPEDSRNVAAVKATEELSKNINVRPDLAERYNRIMQELESLQGTDDDFDPQEYNEAVNAAFKSIGFHTMPDDANEIGEALCADLEALIKA